MDYEIIPPQHRRDAKLPMPETAKELRLRNKIEYRHVVQLAREKSLRAIEYLSYLVDDEEADERVRMMAAMTILERAWGKPRQREEDFPQEDPIDIEKLPASLVEKLANVLEQIKKKLPNPEGEKS
jgi:hypothetical protein